MFDYTFHWRSAFNALPEMLAGSLVTLQVTALSMLFGILIAQLLVAAIIDAFGWLGAERVAFHWNKFAGMALMIGGVVLFKLRL